MSITPTELNTGLVLNQIANQQVAGKLLIAGDLYAGGRAEKLLGDRAANSPWADLHDEINSHHYSIVNLESPLTNNSQALLKSGRILRADSECAIGISAGGFDVVSLANNHIKDMGEIGVIDTITNCENAGLKTVGAGRDMENAIRPLIVEVNELRIAILALAEGEFSIATTGSAGAWPLDIIDNYYQIRKAKEEADFVLVIYHGGVEFYPLPTPDMVKICRFFIDAGANAVVSHHIHIPSGLEVYRSSPIIYSTGNFLFDVPWSQTPDWYRGFLVSLDIQKNAVTKLRLIPYTQGKSDCIVSRMEADETRRFLAKIAAISATIADQDALQREHEELALSKRQRYLSIALSLNKIEESLLGRGIWPFWRTSVTRFARLKNSYTCRSHYDLITSVLKLELEHERFRQSGDKG